MTKGPRIHLISALAQSPGPAAAAMREAWPQARFHNLLDDSLAGDLATLGAITPGIVERFLALGRYAAAAGAETAPTAGVMFTCSAFRPAIDRVRAALAIPVVSPNEGAFEEALAYCAGRPAGGTIALMLTFAGSLAPLIDEVHAIAALRGQDLPRVDGIVADGALAALQSGDGATHDRIVAAAASRIASADVVVIGQFSMARAAAAVAATVHAPLLTTPHAAVRKLRSMVEASA
ncbi:aspartate/glutamate racemase family protein [Novosphingobium sp.]|uniref:aspartate/glutamate racemase family protein n=1 Tax=Novosphingobium sp. TaxID=1874826 RepID=UPI003B52E883